MNDKDLCIYCEKIKTTNRDDDGKPQCASCSNEQYSNDLSMGRRVELKIDMRKVKGSTLTMIKALIEKDIEEFENNKS
jgi:hypothetical protein